MVRANTNSPLRPEAGMAPADAMVLFRSALKQAARRHGYLASFMCRPRLPNTLASGWHLHQSLLDRHVESQRLRSAERGRGAFAARPQFPCRAIGQCGAATAFASPTLNGYKRYRGANTMAPIQAIWARDNRGVMVRVMGETGDPATHLENRVRGAAGQPLSVHGVADLCGSGRHDPWPGSRAICRCAVQNLCRGVAGNA